jgi:hypothetical protein
VIISITRTKPCSRIYTPAELIAFGDLFEVCIVLDFI